MSAITSNRPKPQVNVRLSGTHSFPLEFLY
jgi:hypothetical protein